MPLLCEIWPDIAEIESRSISLDLDQKVDYIGPPRLEIYLLSVGNITGGSARPVGTQGVATVASGGPLRDNVLSAVSAPKPGDGSYFRGV